MKNLTLPAGYLPAIALFTAKKDVRYYLNGVAINRGHLVATNGHYCGALPIADAEGLELIIPDGAISQILKCMTPKQRRESEVLVSIPADVTSELCTLTVGDSVVRFTPIDGRFPDWERITVTISDPTPYDSFNWDYMVLFSKAAKLLGSPTYGEARLLTNGKQVAQVVLPSCTDFRGCIMPMRTRA